MIKYPDCITVLLLDRIKARNVAAADNIRHDDVETDYTSGCGGYLAAVCAKCFGFPVKVLLISSALSSARSTVLSLPDTEVLACPSSRFHAPVPYYIDIFALLRSPAPQALGCSPQVY